MKIEIRARNIQQPQDYQHYIERKIASALSRFRGKISEVTVWLEDINGPKGGIDKRCQVRLVGPNAGPIIAESQDLNLKGALSRAVFIASHALARALRRSQSRALASGREERASFE